MESAHVGGGPWAVILIAVAALISLGSGTTGAASIRGSKHDLSVTGEGPISAVSEQQVCVFCHVPHHATDAQGLANRRTSSAVYVTYGSTTVWGVPPQPGGSSTFCLSCHDGTVALGETASGPRSVANTGPNGTLPCGRTQLGIDLGDDHPVSLGIPAGKPDLHAPAVGDAVKLDRSGLLQCTSCHNPHDPEFTPFLIKSQSSGLAGGALCLSCHRPPDWEGSAHAGATTAAVPPALAVKDPPETVAQSACRACHRVHSADERPRLGRGTLPSRCTDCHNGATGADVAGQFLLSAHHPAGLGSHDPAEDLRSLPETQRHAECPDCHNPHAAKPSTDEAGPRAPGSLTGVGGVSAQYLGGQWVEPALIPAKTISYEYQLCFKCHSGWSYGLTPPVSPSRQLADGLSAPNQTSPALAFNPENSGLHALVGPHHRRGTAAAGAFRGNDRTGTPWGWESILLCTDCHGADLNRPGLRGAHGSSEPFILKAPWIHPSRSGLVTEAETGTLGTRNHLCFLCHDPATYLDGFSANTGFRTALGANLHGGPYHQVGCSACHSGVPHGFKNRAMLVEVADPYPYSAGARVTYLHDAFGPVLPPSGDWEKADCRTDCHH